MVSIIFPEDASTHFLSPIHETLIKTFGPDQIIIHHVEASDHSYSQEINYIKNAPDRSHFLFMGHGQDDRLFGGDSPSFQKKDFIGRSDMSIFKNKYLFSLSCYSSELLRTSLGHSGIINSIGFGTLPTEMTEVTKDKRLVSIGVTNEVVERFKNILVEVVIAAYIGYFQRESSFRELSYFLMLSINKKISEVILEAPTNMENRILADLLFQVKNDTRYL